jgi:hypothetical protein
MLLEGKSGNDNLLLNIFANQALNQRLSRGCIVHLVIKRTNWSNVKTMSCSGSHLGIPINIKNTKFVKDLPMGLNLKQKDVFFR